MPSATVCLPFIITMMVLEMKVLQHLGHSTLIPLANGSLRAYTFLVTVMWFIPNSRIEK